MEKNLKKLFLQMLRIRRVELKIAELYEEQEMRCPVHLSIGQEAVAVGVCSALKKTDVIFFNITELNCNLEKDLLRGSMI